ncbi:MAG: histidine phosphatase family protein [Brevefilum sp.]|nr:histidine phosphatase family protein [Brevefilum sp.]
MKNLLLMRHAKSSWKVSSLSDHERPLKKRGRRDSKRIARELDKNDLYPHVILSSSATRAKETVEVIVDTLDYENRIIFTDELYMAEPEDFIDVLSDLSDDEDNVLVVGHNPGMEAFLQMIDGEIESLPTAALAHLVLAIESWQELSLDTMGDLIGLYRPKEL